MCEAFSCTPTRAMWELEHAPAGLIGNILRLRAYAQTKRDYDTLFENKNTKALAHDRFDEVKEIEIMIMRDLFHKDGED